MPDLSLVTNDEIMQELMGRFDALVFIGEAHRDKTNEVQFWVQHGRWSARIGLCHMLMAKVTRDLMAQDRPPAET